MALEDGDRRESNATAATRCGMTTRLGEMSGLGGRSREAEHRESSRSDHRKVDSDRQWIEFGPALGETQPLGYTRRPEGPRGLARLLSCWDNDLGANALCLLVRHHHPDQTSVSPGVR